MEQEVVEIVEENPSTPNEASLNLTYRFDADASLKLVRTRIEMDRTFSACRNSRQISQAWEMLIKRCGWTGIVSTNKARRRWDNICTLYHRYLNSKDGRLDRAKVRSPYLALIEDYKNLKFQNAPEIETVQEEILIPHQRDEDSLNLDHDYMMNSTSESANSPSSPNKRREIKKKLRSLSVTTASVPNIPSTSSTEGNMIVVNENLMERIARALEQSNQIHTNMLNCVEKITKHLTSGGSTTSPQKATENVKTTENMQNVRRTIVQPVYITAKPLRTYSKTSNQ